MFFESMENHRAFFTKYGQKVTYKKGQYYVMPSDDSPWVFFLINGLVKISFTFSDGNDRLIGFFLPGMTFAQSGSFFQDEGGGGLEYCSVGTSTAYRISRQVFLDQLKKDPAFSQDYVQALLRNQIYLVDRIVYQGEKGIYPRTLRWLLFMAKFYGHTTDPKKDTCTIAVPLTQETAANFMHVTRESASFAFRKLTAKKLISVKKKLITIHSISALKGELEAQEEMQP